MPVRVVVTCSNRKSVEPSEALRFRSITASSVADRARQWFDLVDAEQTRFSATELYAGEHWACASRIPSLAARAGFCADLWVISAGLGLVSDSSQIPAYAATFMANERDSVLPAGSTDSGAASAWWAATQEYGFDERPRSLGELAQSSPSDPMVVAASATYLAPIEADLEEARGNLSDPDLLTIVCAGKASVDGPLTANVMPVDARFTQLVGGSLNALNARLASFIVTGLGPELRASQVTAELERIAAGLGHFHKRDGAKLTDDQVRAFVIERLQSEPGTSRTRMLRQLRDGGFACEQGRFKRLFDLVSATNSECDENFLS